MNRQEPFAYLSYAKRDNEQRKIEELASLLTEEVAVLSRQRSFDVFMSQRLAPGEPFPEALSRIIEEARVLVCILTRNYFESKTCRRELGYFLEKERTLKRTDLVVPIYLVDLPFGGMRDELMDGISKRQHWDARQFQREGWRSPSARHFISEVAERILSVPELGDVRPPAFANYEAPPLRPAPDFPRQPPSSPRPASIAPEAPDEPHKPPRPPGLTDDEIAGVILEGSDAARRDLIGRIEKALPTSDFSTLIERVAAELERAVASQSHTLTDPHSAPRRRGWLLSALAPRAAKRFTNVYRLLKASIASGELADFEGSESTPGSCLHAMALLAILTGAPDAAKSIFPELIVRDEASTWRDAFAARAQTLGHDSVWIAVERILRSYGANEVKVDFKRWVPRVARYSFGTARAVALAGTQNTPDRSRPRAQQAVAEAE